MGVKDQGVAQSRNRYRAVPRTLIFITHGDEVLLLKGASNKRIWPGRYNGVGGHIEAGEAVSEAARREIREETGMEGVNDLRLCGVVNIMTEDPLTGILLFVFTAVSPSRIVRSSDEGQLEWVQWQTLAAENMVDDLPVLLPRVLSMGLDDPPFFARYWYDEHDRLQIAFAPEESERGTP